MPQFKILIGNITEEEVDAIVNAANNDLIAGGGVCGAIHKAAGKELEKLTVTMGGCETGKAKYTEGFNLKTKFIIHTVAPRYNNPFYKYEKSKEELLFSCYQESLNIAESLKLKSISFPALGTGVYGWSHQQSAEIATKAIFEWLKKTQSKIQIRYIVVDKETASIYYNFWEK